MSAYNEGRDVTAWSAPSTVAGGLADNYTWDWREGYKALKGTGGRAVAVDDASILDARRSLGKLEGVFAEPTGSAALAGLSRLKDDGVIDTSDTVCVLVTGSGYKDLGPMEAEFSPPPLIGPSMEELTHILTYLKQ